MIVDAALSDGMSCFFVFLRAKKNIDFVIVILFFFSTSAEQNFTVEDPSSFFCDALKIIFLALYSCGDPVRPNVVLVPAEWNGCGHSRSLLPGAWKEHRSAFRMQHYHTYVIVYSVIYIVVMFKIV